MSCAASFLGISAATTASGSSLHGLRPREREAWAHTAWRSSSCPGLKTLSTCKAAGGKAAAHSSLFRPRSPLEPPKEADAAFKRVKRQTAINKAVFPISQLQMIGPDPREHVGKRPPSCAPNFSINRANRLIARWDSMPQLPRQLHDHHLQSIADAVKEATDPGLDDEAFSPESRCEECLLLGRVPQPDIASILGTSHLRALHPWEGGGCKATGAPSIKCSCCGKDRSPKASRAWRFSAPGSFSMDKE